MTGNARAGQCRAMRSKVTPTCVCKACPPIRDTSALAMKSSIHIVDVDRLETWTRYRPGLCDSCAANCCTMPLEVRLTDLVRLGLVDPFEAEHEQPKQIAKRLAKAGLISHFSSKYGLFTLARRASGDCSFLDAQTRRCTVYAQRPDTCRKHPQVGPRPGHCPYGRRADLPRQPAARLRD
jgi:Fe-S-cluster containining protein